MENTIYGPSMDYVATVHLYQPFFKKVDAEMETAILNVALSNAWQCESIKRNWFDKWVGRWNVDFRLGSANLPCAKKDLEFGLHRATPANVRIGGSAVKLDKESDFSPGKRDALFYLENDALDDVTVEAEPLDLGKFYSPEGRKQHCYDFLVSKLNVDDLLNRKRVAGIVIPTGPSANLDVECIEIGEPESAWEKHDSQVLSGSVSELLTTASPSQDWQSLSESWTKSANPATEPCEPLSKENVKKVLESLAGETEDGV